MSYDSPLYHFVLILLGSLWGGDRTTRRLRRWLTARELQFRKSFFVQPPIAVSLDLNREELYFRLPIVVPYQENQADDCEYCAQT